MLDIRTARLPDCRPLLADPDDLTLAFQPIVSLETGTVAGYEALARFPGVAGPDAWFAAAAETGVAAELEALAVHKALAVVPLLPADTFLTVNVSPHLLGSAPVQAALAGRPDLHRVVVELTEHTPVDDLVALRGQTDRLRERGALIALDDAGSGYSGLQQMAALRPQLVKLDRALVSDADADPVRMALAEMVGEFAGRIDAWLLAEGVETPAELAAFAQLGVPLAQGWLLGRPGPTFAPLAPEVTQLVRAQVARARLTESVASLLRPVRQCSPGEESPGIPPAVLVGVHGEPTGLLLADLRTAQVYTTEVTLRVHPSTDIDETLQRALTRAPAHRFEPVVCTDPTGQVLGIVRVEDLITAARRAADKDPPAPHHSHARGGALQGSRTISSTERRSHPMKRFACGDVIPGCSATFTAADDEGIFAQVVPHAAADHGVTEITPELQETVRSLISTGR